MEKSGKWWKVVWGPQHEECNWRQTCWAMKEGEKVTPAGERGGKKGDQSRGHKKKEICKGHGGIINQVKNPRTKTFRGMAK